MEILNEFGIKPVLLAAQVVNFLILLYILKRLLYGPILKVLKERKDKIAQSLKSAEEIEKRLVEISEEEQKRIAKVVAEGEEMRKQTEAALALLYKDGQEKAKVMVDKMIEEGRIQLLQDGKKLEEKMKGNFVRLFSLGFEKITGKPLGKEQKESIEKTVKELT